ncbi:hypothetical protein CT0861_11270 [Colletotrichum tofieldiae]|uniref:Uncharacterized protein n=1 Tax=Colletotrichum tofieldiae TaxID=708197 RepID=A0A166NFY3_9PEZI|nr:hypothetical protein CT0861_11270 [Colletotrichum tofieldiae]
MVDGGGDGDGDGGDVGSLVLDPVVIPESKAHDAVVSIPKYTKEWSLPVVRDMLASSALRSCPPASGGWRRWMGLMEWTTNNGGSWWRWTGGAREVEERTMGGPHEEAACGGKKRFGNFLAVVAASPETIALSLFRAANTQSTPFGFFCQRQHLFVWVPVSPSRPVGYLLPFTVYLNMVPSTTANTAPDHICAAAIPRSDVTVCAWLQAVLAACDQQQTLTTHPAEPRPSRKRKAASPPSHARLQCSSTPITSRAAAIEGEERRDPIAGLQPSPSNRSEASSAFWGRCCYHRRR